MLRIKGFTLMELMVVVIAVGIIAAFAVPSYQRALDRSYARDAVNNLILIGAAQQVYRARTGTNIFPADTNAINTTFNLNIIAQAGLTYSCNPAGAGSCSANLAGLWSYAFTLPNTDVIVCSGGTCPYTP